VAGPRRFAAFREGGAHRWSPMSALDVVLAKLPDAKRVGDRYMARCPAHPDKSPSLSIAQGCRGVVMRCYAGCSPGDVVGAMGLTLSELFDDHLEHRGNGTSESWDADRAAVELANRGLTLATVRHFKIEACPEQQEWRFPLGQGRGFKFKAFRNGNGKPKYRNEPGVQAGVYHLKPCEGQPEAYCVEGEPDVWTMHQAGLLAFSFTGGAETVPTDAVQAIARAKIGLVRIVYDRDEAGRKGAANVSAALTKAGVKNVVLELPTKVGPKGDITDLYNVLGGDDAAFRRALAALPTAGVAAAQVQAAELAAAQQTAALERSAADYSKEPPWPWASLTTLIGPVLPEELIVVGARPGCGKTTFLMNLLESYLLSEVGWVFAGMETSAAQLRRKFAAFRLGLNQAAVLRNQWSALPPDAREQIDADVVLQTTHLTDRAVFLDTPRLDVAEMSRAMEFTARLGCRIFVVDHVHQMAFGGSGDNITYQMGEAVRTAKDLAKTHRLTVILAAELNRPERDQAFLGDYLPPSLSALKQTGALEEAADTVLLLSKALRSTATTEDIRAVRHQQKPLTDIIDANTMAVLVGKHRLDGSAVGHTAWLTLDATGRLAERRHGWQATPAATDERYGD
jgi:KaiC/GvpD/RAD55 family RecA-like ATPase